MKVFEKNDAFLLYWLAVHQQTSTSRIQKPDFSLEKVSAQFNEFSLSYKGHREWPNNC